MFNNIKNLLVCLFALYSLIMSIYSGYTADNNKPVTDSKGLFIASYVICIICCIIYLGMFFNMLLCLIKNNYKSNDEKSNELSILGIPLLLNIYWLVLYFNYKVSDKYDEFALVKTIEFFIILGILVLLIVCVLPLTIIYFNKTTKIVKKINTNNTSNNITDSKNVTAV